MVKLFVRFAAVALAATFATGSNALALGRDPGLPNPVATPGATNARVTQATIRSTICVPGYSSSVRPPESYTQKLKYHQLDTGYNLRGDTRASHYEEDHLIPLEVGGSPTSVKNLWPEPWNTTWNAGKKDSLENTMHRLVCSGAVLLTTAQRVFAANWIVGYQRYVAS